MHNYVVMCKGICSYNLVSNFLIQLLQLKSSVFVVHFSKAFQHGNEAFLKGSSSNEIVLFLTIFYFSYSKYRGVKNVFTRVAIKIKIFHWCCTHGICVALASHLCCSCSTRVALVLHLCCSSCLCFTRVSLMLHSCRICITPIAVMSLLSGNRVVHFDRL